MLFAPRISAATHRDDSSDRTAPCLPPNPHTFPTTRARTAQKPRDFAGGQKTFKYALETSRKREAEEVESGEPYVA
jgi:hypothetical protein